MEIQYKGIRITTQSDRYSEYYSLFNLLYRRFSYTRGVDTQDKLCIPTYLLTRVPIVQDIFPLTLLVHASLQRHKRLVRITSSKWLKHSEPLSSLNSLKRITDWYGFNCTLRRPTSIAIVVWRKLQLDDKSPTNKIRQALTVLDYLMHIENIKHKLERCLWKRISHEKNSRNIKYLPLTSATGRRNGLQFEQMDWKIKQKKKDSSNWALKKMPFRVKLKKRDGRIVLLRLVHVRGRLCSEFNCVRHESPMTVASHFDLSMSSV